MKKKLKAEEFWELMGQVGIGKGDYKQLAMYIESMYWAWRSEDEAAGREFLSDIWNYRANLIHDELKKKGFYK